MLKRLRSWALYSVALVATSYLAACARAPVYEGRLVFKREGRVLKTIALNDLAAQVGLRVIESADPYYGARKRFRAFPLADALAFAYGTTPAALRESAFLLVALDGYAVPIAGQRVLDDGAFVALDDVDVPGFAPIGPRRTSPLPAYLVWQGSAQKDLETHPRPWQLSAIDRVSADALYPHAKPRAAAQDSPALRGFHLFRERCIRCHAINREGGNVGPELNVPQSIVAYRPEEQIRAYIRNPLTFRYGAMPANPDLTDHDLDALIAYFHTMAAEPYDPTRKSP